MFRQIRHLAAAVAVATVATAAHSAIVYSLANDSTTLIRFNTATPGVVTTIGPISGAISSLAGLDFRPADGLLYGYSSSASGIYRVNPATGVTTLVSTSSAPVTTPLTGIDFNPVADRMRVVTANDENRRINVDTGVAISDGTLAYAVGDANAGANPNIIDAAYTNNDRNPATGTTLYYIDYLLDILVSTSNPNGGVLNTIGALGVDADSFLGFDIYTDGGGFNTGYASLRSGGVDRLYTVNLGTGAATLVGTIGAQRLFGLAVLPDALPEPGSLALVGLAGLAAFGARRRSMAAAR